MFSKTYLAEVEGYINTLDPEAIERAVDALYRVRRRGGRVLGHDYDTGNRKNGAAMKSEATTMTVKGQVTIPREIRERLGLQSGDKVAWSLLSDGTVVVRPKTRRLADLVGSLTRPGQPSVAVEDMDP